MLVPNKIIKLRRKLFTQLEHRKNQLNKRITNKDRFCYYRDVFEYDGHVTNKNLKEFEETNPDLKEMKSHNRRKEIKRHKLAVIDKGIQKKQHKIKKLIKLRTG